MITKKSFIAMLDAIRKQMDRDEENGRLMTLLSNPHEDGFNCVFTTPITSKLIQILADEMQSVSEPVSGNDIEYWIYEADCGKKFNKMWRADGSEVPLKTASDLYDWLLENFKEK